MTEGQSMDVPPPAPPSSPSPAPPPPVSALERITALEARVAALETALRRAFGDRWMNER